MPDPMFEAKIAQAVEILEELDIDCWMTLARESATVHDPTLDLVVGGNVTWISAFLITRTGRRIAILGSLDVAAHEALGHYQEIVPYVKGVRASLLQVLADLDPRRIAINYSAGDELADGLPHGLYLKLLDLMEGTPYGARLVSSEGIVARLRARKQPPEVERITRACTETVDLFRQMHTRIRAGMTERQVAAIMVEIMEAKGLERAWDPDHCPAVFTGPESAGAHAGPTDRVMESGHLMNVDFGMRYQGYCSDLQRTWYCLRPGESAPPPAVMAGFEAVRVAIRKAAAFLRPGVMGHEVDAVARGHITSAGFPEYPHALGHQIGRHAHDGAGLLCPIWERYGERPFARVEAGQCYTIEPRAPVEGHGVATMEEIVVVTADGCRWLSDPQDEIWLLGPPQAARTTS